MEEAVAVEEKACGGRNLTRVKSRGEEERGGREGRVRGEEAADNIFLDLWGMKMDGERRGRGDGDYIKRRSGTGGWVKNLTRVIKVSVWG